MSDIRPSPIAGTWYPGDPRVLSQSIDQQLQSAELPQIDGEVIALIAPHAGHRYSGHVAAHAFRCLEGLDLELVALLSPMHGPYRNAVLTSAHAAYGTPLGVIEVDHELVQRFAQELHASSDLELEAVRCDDEHSLEIELPFLQRSLSQGFRLLPLMLRDQSRATSEAVGHALARVLTGERAILVASTDLSHFYPQHVAEKLDREVLRRLENFDPEGILAAEEEGIGFACGRGAMAAALWAAGDLGADQALVLKYATSGDVTGDMHSVVGYAAAVLYHKTEH